VLERKIRIAMPETDNFAATGTFSFNTVPPPDLTAPTLD
jgi:hypothetical protein